MNAKKKLAAKVLKTSHGKIRFAAGALEDVAKAITRADIRGLAAVGKIVAITPNQQSHVRARKNAAQKAKGRQKGKGSRKGRKFANVSRKEQWMSRIRTQRAFLQDLKEKKLLSVQNFRMLYLKSKGGYFRNKRHIKLFMTERNLFENSGKSEQSPEQPKVSPLRTERVEEE